MSIPNRVLKARFLRDTVGRNQDEQPAEPSQTRLAILDDYADIASRYFENLPGLEVQSYPDTVDVSTAGGLSVLQQRLQPFTIISSMRERTAFSAELLANLPNLRLLLTTGMRNASIDLDAALKHDIVVTGTKGAPTQTGDASQPHPRPVAYDSTTQQTWALLLSLCSRIPHDDAALRSNHSSWQSGFAYALGGKTMSILGLGRLGANTARIAVQAFGMNVIAWSENLTQEKADAAAQLAGLPNDTYRVVSKEDLFRLADVLSIHYVLSDRSRDIVGRHELALLKRSAIVINTARGPLVDEAALLDTLQRGAIRGAALDVWWQEPLPPESPWRTYAGKSELVMSPHMGYVNEGTMYRWYEEQAMIVKQWLEGAELSNRMN